MSADRVSDDELDALGGDCTPFIQLCHCLRRKADTLGLSAAERHAWIDLLMAADYRTGIIGSITWQGTADLLGCSVPTAKERLNTLEELGLIRCRFPRGHQGFVAVVSYLDVVRVKSPRRAEAIAGELAKAVARADEAAARSSTAKQTRNRASRAGDGPHNDEGFRSDEGNLRSGTPASLPHEFSEPPGDPRHSEAPAACHLSSSSRAAVSGQSRGTPSPAHAEETRSDRIRAYDASLLGKQP